MKSSSPGETGPKPLKLAVAIVPVASKAPTLQGKNAAAEPTDFAFQGQVQRHIAGSKGESPRAKAVRVIGHFSFGCAMARWLPESGLVIRGGQQSVILVGLSRQHHNMRQW